MFLGYLVVLLPYVMSHEMCNGVHDAKIPHPRDCTKYLICGQHASSIMQCPSGLHFDRRIGICNFVEFARCTAGKFAMDYIFVVHLSGCCEYQARNEELSFNWRPCYKAKCVDCVFIMSWITVNHIFTTASIRHCETLILPNMSPLESTRQVRIINLISEKTS